ncbi:MAG TPA: molybdopterin-binding protein [Chloroflexota bacterium]|nr:molybdopterin-binding protein [Chloroflexota bacterium]
MRAFALEPEAITEERVVGTVLCQNVVAADAEGRHRIDKGQILTADDIPALRAAGEELHLIAMEPGDLHENAASTRLARAVAGDGLDIGPPVESQTHLRAARRGIVEVDTDALRRINLLPDMSVFTVYDGQPVLESKPVAATKVTPLVVPEEVVARAEEIARDAAPVVRVRPFTGGAVGVVVRERIGGRARERFESAIQMKVGWFGSPVAGIRYLSDDVEEIASALDCFTAEGVSLILAAGVNSTDPLDLTIQALDRLGAETERRGVPAHPGSTCWLSYLGDVPVFGLAMCGMFSRTTVLDLLLPRFLSGQRVRAEEIAEFGHGGVLNKDMAFRFPPYTDAS